MSPLCETGASAPMSCIFLRTIQRETAGTPLGQRYSSVLSTVQE